MWLRILGLPDGVPSWWNAQNVDDAEGAALDELLRHRLPGYRFSVGGTPLARLRWDGRDRAPVLSVVARPGDDSTADRDSGPEVVMVTEDGPDAGLLAPLPRSGLTVGRNHAEVRVADPFLSGPHFQAVVDPEGIRVIPLTRPRAGAIGDGAEGHQSGTVPWSEGSSSFRLVRGRPDPLPARTTVPPHTIDPGPAPSRPNALLQGIMALGPLVIGVVLAVATGHWYFLLFSLISVGVAGVMWGQHRSARAAHGRRIVRAATDLAERLEALAPSPGTLALAARSSAEDRFGTLAPDHGPPLVRWGTGTTALPLSSDRDRTDWSAWSRTSLPVISELHPGGVTRVAGQRSTLEAMSCWLVVQLCRDAAVSSRGVLVRSASGDAWWGGGVAAAEGTAVLHPGATGEGIPETWHRIVLRGTGIADEGWTDGDRLFPEEARATLGGLDYEEFRWHGMSASTMGWLVDELGGSVRPRTTRSPSRMALPVRPRTATASLQSALTGGPDPVVLDLVRDGPHALIAGTTGSGKSELLLTALTGLAAGYPPAEVSFVLMDFKGGSSFVPLSGLPHTMSVETNLVEAQSLRTFDALTAELRRREELFLAAGSVDYTAFRRCRPHEVLPRLVVAIDELRVLVEDHPQSAAVLARLAATGRSLGVHLVLATQRAQGAVGPDVRSNLGTVICLRTATEQESWDLLGRPDAHAIDAGSPGSAFIRHGGAPPRSFQAGRFAGTPGPPELVPWDGGGRDGVSGHPQDEGGPAAWTGLVDQIRQNAGRWGLSVPETVVMPALPDHWCPTAADHLGHPGAVVAGLADLPQDRRQEPVVWVPGRDRPVAWIGTDTGGLREAARSVLRQLASLSGETSASAPPWRTLVLDGHGESDCEGGTGPRRTGHRDAPDPWTVLTPAQAVPERLATLVRDLRADLAAHRPVRLVVTAWGRWSGMRVGTGYETVEEHLALLLRDHPPSLLAAALFGGRDLAGGRVLGQVPNRFYVPAGSTPEQRMVWPTLHRVREVPGRAVMVTPEHPAPGVAVQLALAVTGPASASRAPTSTDRSA